MSVIRRNFIILHTSEDLTIAENISTKIKEHRPGAVIELCESLREERFNQLVIDYVLVVCGEKLCKLDDEIDILVSLSLTTKRFIVIPVYISYQRADKYITASLLPIIPLYFIPGDEKRFERNVKKLPFSTSS